MFAGKVLIYLVDVHHGLPLVIALYMEVVHSNLAKIPRMVFIEVRSMMVLASSKTALEISGEAV